MEAVLETIDLEEDSASGDASATSDSSAHSSSSSQQEDPPAAAQPNQMDGSNHVLAKLHQTIHVVATWNAPLETSRQLKWPVTASF